MRQQWGVKQISLRSRSKRATPATNSGLASPREITVDGGRLTSAQWSNDETSGDRYARAHRRAEKVPSPKQNRARVRFTIQFIESLGLKSYRHQWLRNDAGKYIQNVVSPEPKALPVPSPRISYQCTSGSMHIKMKFVHYFLFVSGIHLSLVAYSGFGRLCTDHGPDGQNRHEYTGWHHICCLNNMASVRSDLHELFDAFEIGIDFHVRISLLGMKYF